MKRQGSVETPRQWQSPALGPKESLRQTIMVMKSLDFVPFNETLHLPLKVWGSHALHKESLGSARSPEVQGRHSEALWH